MKRSGSVLPESGKTNRHSKCEILVGCLDMICLLSVLWHCWLGGRKGIRPVKNWMVGCWRGYLSGARCRLDLHKAQMMPLPLTVSCFSKIQIGFYRAMLCIRGTSHGPVSVRLSVTSRSSTKTAKRRITQTTSHDTSVTLVFWRQRSPRNSTGVTPYGGAECRWGG